METLQTNLVLHNVTYFWIWTEVLTKPKLVEGEQPNKIGFNQFLVWIVIINKYEKIQIVK